MGLEGLLWVMAAVYVVGVLLPRDGMTIGERAREPFGSLLWGMFWFPVWGTAVVVVVLTVI